MKVWEGKWVAIVENNMAPPLPPPPIIKLPYDSAVSRLGFCPKEQKEDPEQTDTLSKPFTATVVTEARAEASQMSTRRCADEQSMLYRNKKILVSLKKGRDSTACRSMD